MLLRVLCACLLQYAVGLELKRRDLLFGPVCVDGQLEELASCNSCVVRMAPDDRARKVLIGRPYDK